MTTDGDKVPHSSSASSFSSMQKQYPYDTGVNFLRSTVLFNMHVCTVCITCTSQTLQLSAELLAMYTCTGRCSCRHVHVHVNSILEDELIARVCHRNVYVVCKHCASQTTCKDMDRISKLCAASTLQYCQSSDS